MGNYGSAQTPRRRSLRSCKPIPVLNFAELQANPCIELCGCKLEKNEMQTPWIRFSAEVMFEERLDIRDAIIEKSSIVNALYKNMRDNPIFKVFYHERSKNVLVIVCFCSPFDVFMGFCFSRPAWPFCTQAQMS